MWIGKSVLMIVSMLTSTLISVNLTEIRENRDCFSAICDYLLLLCKIHNILLTKCVHLLQVYIDFELYI